ncbi:hypothetical protein HYPSUDRAFT_235175 [Hypholoma sublateritium FD-334 SS-4]|uniref:Uncharacterized protein n=1 Tax=Hypholoma sublateritium (strain FD-334 SS-4) TaxID=945553 RepID=A0A0D2N060_HYPSF|nr:hypothetical protein HYPSUDRAFT_235175 [Hypholoma sublateritium FD-334 SS-4]
MHLLTHSKAGLPNTCSTWYPYFCSISLTMIRTPDFRLLTYPITTIHINIVSFFLLSSKAGLPNTCAHWLSSLLFIVRISRLSISVPHPHGFSSRIMYQSPTSHQSISPKPASHHPHLRHIHHHHATTPFQIHLLPKHPKGTQLDPLSLRTACRTCPHSLACPQIIAYPYVLDIYSNPLSFTPYLRPTL